MIQLIRVCVCAHFVERAGLKLKRLPVAIFQTSRAQGEATGSESPVAAARGERAMRSSAALRVELDSFMSSMAKRKSNGPMKRFMTMVATASVENACPQYGNRAATVLAKPKATPAWVTCAIHSMFRLFSPVMSLSAGALRILALMAVAQYNAQDRKSTRLNSSHP